MVLQWQENPSAQFGCHCGRGSCSEQLIEIGGQGTDAVVRELSGFSEVSAVHTTNGKWDLVVELGTTDLIEFDKVLRRIRLVPGTMASETNLLLATPRSVKAKL